MKKRITSVIVAVLLLIGCVTSAFAAEGLGNFETVNTYASGQFKDVADGKWYTENVKTAYELGLMKGSNSKFNLNGSITLAETLAIACRIHDTYYGGTEAFEQGSPWYQVYVDYAIAKDIIAPGEYAEYTKPAARMQFAKIIAASVPESALNSINTVTSIPDVPQNAEYAKDVYMLYNAGVLTGSDKYGTFNPESNISRSEVAAIVTRVADVSLRKEVELVPKPVAVTGVKLDKSSLTLTTGKSATLTAAVTPDNATDKTVTWSSSNPSVAAVSNGTVTAKAQGTAKITASCGGFNAVCMVTVTQAPIEYTGVGSKVISNINLSAGDYYAEFTHKGSSNFIVKLYYGDDKYDYMLLANEIGNCAGQVFLDDTRNKSVSGAMLEIKADGAWSVSLKPVAGSTTTNIKGSGKVITGIFTATTARTVFTLNHTGSSNFIVKIWEVGGSHYDYELLANEIGNYSGQSIQTLTQGKQYFFAIRADGSWSIDLGLGDSVTQYAPPAIPDGAASGSGSSSGSASGSSSSGHSYYYDRFPGVPDFGYCMGGVAPLVEPYNASENSGSFFYSAISVINAGHGNDYATRYDRRLTSCGFKYQLSFKDDEGNPVLVYSNGTYDLMMGAATIQGIVGTVITVIPAE